MVSNNNCYDDDEDWDRPDDNASDDAWEEYGEKLYESYNRVHSDE